MPMRVKNWLDGLPPIIKEKLDFSPASIVTLQKYLWDEYDEYSITDIKNRDEAECAGYYYGEILRKNLPIDMKWKSSDILSDEDISSMLLINERGIKDIHNLISHLPPLITRFSHLKIMGVQF